tara:strand:- start:118 stop:285 length:168 start_codon:yes stop_codon:yes gene_type:complete
MKNIDRTIFIIKPNYLYNNKKSRKFDKNSPTQANTSKRKFICIVELPDWLVWLND